ncbi:MAG TPA: hypothetical protein VLG72_00830 [Nitrospirota bacterium]|nr:hypothetical protein [Nitrospirota bacterium]
MIRFASAHEIVEDAALGAFREIVVDLGQRRFVDLTDHAELYP